MSTVAERKPRTKRPAAPVKGSCVCRVHLTGGTFTVKPLPAGEGYTLTAPDGDFTTVADLFPIFSGVLRLSIVSETTKGPNAQDYTVAEIKTGHASPDVVIELRKADDGTVYHVHSSPDGPVCDCADFTFRRSKEADPAARVCRHGRALQVLNLLS
jgi:hypothetical protein